MNNVVTDAGAAESSVYYASSPGRPDSPGTSKQKVGATVKSRRD
ncbi:MAG: hypothetical protein ACR2NB_14145 [Solirubrobacteraceae bacterium]